METGIVSIDFIGVAESYFATSARVKADLLELKKLQSELNTGVAVPGGMVAGQSLETQVAPVRAASVARRQIYKDEAEARAAAENAAAAGMTASIDKDLRARREFLTIGKNDYDEYLNYLKARTIKANEEMAASTKASMEAATRANIEASRSSSAFVPTQWIPGIPGMRGGLPEVPRETGITPENIEEDIRARRTGETGNFFRRRPYLVARGMEDTFGGIGRGMEGDLGGMIGGAGGMMTVGGAYGLMTSPEIAIPAIGAGIAAFGLEHTFKVGGGFQSAGAKLQAGTEMSDMALAAFRKVAREQAIKAGNTPESKASDFLEAARTLIFALHLSGDEVDRNLPALLKMMEIVRQYATAMGIPVNDAAHDLVTKFNLTGGKMTDTKPEQEFKTVADMFAMATTRGALKPEELGSAVRKAGGVAAFEGLPTSDVLAALEIMGTSGDTGQVIGTALRQYLLTLGGAKQSKRLDAAMSNAGLDIKDISIARKSLPDAIQVLTEHLGTMSPGGEYTGGTSKLSPEDRNELLKELFGQRWLSFYQQLSSNLPAFRKISSGIQTQSGGSVERMAGTMEQTVQFKEGVAGKTFQDAFLKLFIEHEHEFGNLADDFVKMAGALVQLEPLMGKFVTLLTNTMDTLTGHEEGNILPSGVLTFGAPLSKTLGQPAGRALEAQIHSFDQAYSHWFDTQPNSPQKEATRAAILRSLDILMGEDSELSNPTTTEARKKVLYENIKEQFQALRKNLGITSDEGFENMLPTPFGGMPGHRSGGYTGDGAPDEPAGVVHGGEFVFDAISTRRAGVRRLRALQKKLRGYADGDFVTPVPLSDFRTDPIAQPSEDLPVMMNPLPIWKNVTDDSPGVADSLLSMFMSEGGPNRIADLIHGKATFQRLWSGANPGDVASGIAGLAQSGQFQQVLKSLGASKGLRSFTSGNTLSDIAQIIGMGTQGVPPMQRVSLSGEDVFGHVTGSAISDWIAQAHKAANPSVANVGGNILGHAAPFVDMIVPGSGAILSQLGNVLGSFATGTPYVPKTGLYQLHQGESVTPAGGNGPLRLHRDTIRDMVSAFSAVQLGIEPTSIRTGFAQGNNSFQTWD